MTAIYFEMYTVNNGQEEISQRMYINYRIQVAGYSVPAKFFQGS